MKYSLLKHLNIFILLCLVCCQNPENKNIADTLKADSNSTSFLNEQARMLATSNTDLARIYALKAKKAAGTDTLNLALAYHLIGMTYYFEGNPANAILYYDSSLILNHSIHNLNQLSKTYNNLGAVYNEIGQNEKAINYFNQSLLFCRQIGDSIGVARAIGNLGNVYQNLGDFAKTLQVNETSLALRKLLNDTLGMGSTLMNLGIVYKTLGNYEKALENYFEALVLHEKTGNLRNKAIALYNIGNVYHDWQKSADARKYYANSLKISEEAGFKQGMAFALNQLGTLAKTLKEFDTAMVCYKKALAIFEQINDANGIANIYSDLAFLNRTMDKLDQAKFYAEESRKKYIEIGDKNGEAIVLQTLSLIEMDSKRYGSALQYALLGEKLCTETGNRNTRLGLLHNIGEIYYELHNYENSTKYLLKKVALNDSIFNDANNKKVADFNTLFEVEKREKEIAVHKSKLAMQDLKLTRQKNVTNLLLASIAGLVMIIGLIAYFYKQKQKANRLISMQKQEIEDKNTILVSQNEEIKAQNEEISAQRDKLFKQHKEITDSINYARIIQSALLPSENLLNEIFTSHFVLFKPRNVVSGDFYWARNLGNPSVLVVADCTGHGVPGAFMSVMGISLLNEVIKPAENLNPSHVLGEMRQQIKSLLRQSNRAEGTRDGMDMAICILDKTNKILKYAGANISLFLFRNNEITEIDADKMTVGIHPKDNIDFTSHTANLLPNDRFFLFSDGFADQFGGKDNRKFKRQALLSLLATTSTLNMQDQKKELELAFENFKGNYNQIDDVMVVGFQVL